MHCYCIHSHRFLKRETERTFWSVQAAIVKQLRESRSLSIIWVYIHTSCDANLVTSFKRTLQKSGSRISVTNAYYPDLGDSVADSGTFILGVHKSATSNHAAIKGGDAPSYNP